jgi:hypothetical protein
VSATNNVATVAFNVVPELYGEAFDPTGDSFNPAPNPPADLVFASARSRNGNLEIIVRFAAGTRTSVMNAQMSLDTNQNAATGHPGVASNGSIDPTILGDEFLVDLGQAFNGGQSRVLRYVGPPINTFAFVASYPATFSGDEMRTTVPLSALGNDNGLLNFKVTSYDLLSPSGTTGILDILTNAGLPAVSTAPLGGPIINSIAASPFAQQRTNATSVGETSLLNARPVSW